MDKLFVRKDVYEEMLEKGFGKRDLSKLTKKQITDKNGHKRTVYVRNGEQPETQKQPKTQELTEGKRARYEEMLEKVKAGPDENALFVSSKGMLNKKDAIAHLEGKLGKKAVNNEWTDPDIEKKAKTMTDSALKNGIRLMERAAKNSEMNDRERNSADKLAKLYKQELTSRASSNNVAQKMADAEDKAFEESEKDAQKKYGNMSIEELKAEAKKYDGVNRYSPEANEARKVYDILNQKLKEEKKNSKTKTEPKSKKFSYDDAVNAIKEGKTVQWKSRDGSWNDVDPKSSELVMARDIGSELRVKPSQEEKNTDISQKSSDELQAEQDKIREEYREYFASDDYDEDSEKTQKYVQQLEYYDEQIENAKVRETGMTRYVREGYENMMDAKEERLPEITADLEQRLANEQETLERYNKMKPRNKIYKDSLEVNKWAAQRNIDEYLGGLKAINERMGKK